MPPLFDKTIHSGVHEKKIYFSPGVPPLQHITTWMMANTQIMRYFQNWGFWEEKVGRQGKGDQSVCNEPIDPPLGPWVHNMACSGENRFSKLKISKNDPYFSVFFQREFLQEHLRQITEIRVIFGNFEF